MIDMEVGVGDSDKSEVCKRFKHLIETNKPYCVIGFDKENFELFSNVRNLDLLNECLIYIILQIRKTTAKTK